MQGADYLVGKYGGATSQPVEIRAAASVKRLETEFPEAKVIGSLSFAAPKSDAKKDETALIAFLREMDPHYIRNKHTEGGAGSSGLTTTPRPVKGVSQLARNRCRLVLFDRKNHHFARGTTTVTSFKGGSNGRGRATCKTQGKKHHRWGEKASREDRTPDLTLTRRMLYH